VSTAKLPVDSPVAPDTNWAWAVGLSTLFVLVRLAAVRLSPLQLYADEAQYWVWSRHLDFGYFTKPPLIAWLIRLFVPSPGACARPRPCVDTSAMGQSATMSESMDHQSERIDLAAAFRWLARLDMHESVANHLSVAVSADGAKFLINPRGRHFRRPSCR